MNRIDKTFETLAAEKRKALVGFVTAGDPTPPQSLTIVEAMLDAGLDVLELGVPFSDPSADGPVIQRASQRALAKGVTLKRVLAMTAQLRTKYDVPIVVFSYYNPLLAYGLDAFYTDAVAAGVDGVLVVDLPPEESEELTGAWSGDALHLIRLVAPTTAAERVAAISKVAGGFIYMITRTGVTGGGSHDAIEIEDHIRDVRDACPFPVCLGFGISTPDQAAKLAPMADGVVVGSAFERIIEEGREDPDVAQAVAARVAALKAAIG